MGKTHLSGKKFVNLLNTHGIQILNIYKKSSCILMQLVTRINKIVFFILIPQEYILKIKTSDQLELQQLDNTISNQVNHIKNVDESLDILCISSSNLTYRYQGEFTSFLIGVEQEKEVQEDKDVEQIETIKKEIDIYGSKIVPNYGDKEVGEIQGDIVDPDVVVHLEFRDEKGQQLEMVDLVEVESNEYNHYAIKSEKSDKVYNFFVPDEIDIQICNLYVLINIQSFYKMITEGQQVDNFILEKNIKLEHDIASHQSKEIESLSVKFDTVQAKLLLNIKKAQNKCTELERKLQDIYKAKVNLDSIIEKTRLKPKKFGPNLQELQQKENLLYETIYKIRVEYMKSRNEIELLLSNYNIYLDYMK